MSRSRGVESGARRAALIMRTVEDVMVRRARGEQLTDAEVAAANPELMPDLGKELSLLSMLERARNSVSRVGGSSGGRVRRGQEGSIQPLGEDAFEGFRVIGEVHRGGQGVVYEAVQASTGRRVAIKMMREGLFAGDRDAARFEREVRILGQLEHPGIVGIIASGIQGGHFYYVMDYVQGLPLDEFVVGRSTRAVLEVMQKVADALNAAHLKGIIHRDLKPGNILVCSDGSPRLLDFGLARIAAEGEQRVTMTGQFVGSMPWSSPEQAAGDQAKVDVRTDVYSMGVIMYHAFTGRFPYSVDGTPRDVLNNILNASPSRLRSGDSEVDAGIDAIVRKCLAKERERRYQSAGELAADIRRHLTGQPVLAHPPDAWYQAKMFARRNRALVIGGAAVLAALFLGLVGTTTGLLEASASKRVAVQERDAAKKSEAIAKSQRAEAEASAYAASIAAADAALRVNDGANAKTHLRAAPQALRGWEWKFLATQADRSEETLKLPRVIAARTTPDGNHLLALERAGALSLTDLRDGRLVWRVKVPASLSGRREQAIIGVSGDGRLAVTQHDGAVSVWNLTQGALEQTLSQRGTTWGLMTASFSPDGSRLLTCGRQGMMCVWSLSENRIIAEMAVNESFCSGADYSPDGALIAVSVFGGVKVLDGETLEFVRLLKATDTRYPDWGFVRFTPDGKRVIANFGNSLASLDVRDQSPPVVFRGGVQDFMRFNLSADGRHLVAGSWDRTVREWNVRTGALELTLTGHELQVNEASFGLNDTRVYSTDDDGVVKCWRPREQFEPGVLALFGAMQVSVIGAGDRAVFYGKDRVRMVDIETEREIPANLPADALGVSISPDGERMAYAIGISAEQSLWDLKAGKRLWTATGPAEYIHQSRFSPDGSMIVTTANDGTLCVWDAAKGELKRSIKNANSPPAMIRFHPKKPELVVGGAWRQLEVWDTNTWVRRIVAVPADTAHTFVNALAYSPDGALLVAGDGEGQLTIWDTTTWSMVRALPTLRAVVWKLEFSPDGTRLAAACHDRMIHLFRTSDWQETLLLRGHTGVVTSLDWTPDGRRLLSSAVDGTIRIWDSGRIKWDIGAGDAGKKEEPAGAGH